MDQVRPLHQPADTIKRYTCVEDGCMKRSPKQKHNILPPRDGSRVSALGQRGMALLLVIFLLALLAIVVCGILQMNTEEIQILTNHMGMAQAQAIAEAGLHHALAKKRRDPSWQAGFHNRPFADGQYSVALHGDTLTATGRSPQGYEMSVRADIAVVQQQGQRLIQIQSWRVNP